MPENDTGRSSPDEVTREKLLRRSIAQPNEHAMLLLDVEGRIVG